MAAKTRYFNWVLQPLRFFRFLLDKDTLLKTIIFWITRNSWYKENYTWMHQKSLNLNMVLQTNWSAIEPFKYVNLYIQINPQKQTHTSRKSTPTGKLVGIVQQSHWLPRKQQGIKNIYSRQEEFISFRAAADTCTCEPIKEAPTPELRSTRGLRTLIVEQTGLALKTWRCSPPSVIFILDYCWSYRNVRAQQQL